MMSILESNIRAAGSRSWILWCAVDATKTGDRDTLAYTLRNTTVAGIRGALKAVGAVNVPVSRESAITFLFRAALALRADMWRADGSLDVWVE